MKLSKSRLKQLIAEELQFLKEVAPEIFQTNANYNLSTLCQKKDGLSRIPTIYKKENFDLIYNDSDLVKDKLLLYLTRDCIMTSYKQDDAERHAI